VAADQTPDVARAWEIAEEILADPQLASAVHVIGAHYVSSTGWKFALREPYASTEEAKKTGKPLWASEDGPWRGDWEGARALAKIFNRGYIVGRMTKTIFWSLITSYYDNLPIPGSGPMRANTPWSGAYEVQPALWAIAHTTQFAQPGWQYLDNACGMLEGGGSYVVLKDSSTTDWSMIIETLDATSRQAIVVKLLRLPSAHKVAVWRTTETQQFEKQKAIDPSRDSFSIDLEPNAIYSLTTTEGQQKGNPVHPIPPVAGFPSSYREDFEDTSVGKTPRFFSDLYGTFEVVRAPKRSGHALQQVIPGPGIEWPLVAHRVPRTIVGSRAWRDYQVSCEVFLNEGGWGELGARFDKPWDSGYWLRIHSDGSWKVSANGKISWEGKVERTSQQRWNRLSVRCAGDRVTFFIDGEKLAAMQDTTFRSGLAGLGTGWNKAYFDNFEVVPVSH
jgi:galactosylceramidase